MAKLLTHHDRYHLHAFLGLCALLHFAFRFGSLVLGGVDNFAPTVTSALCLSVHFLLHATSFQFALPAQRIMSKPMIWPEFRVHNAIFAYRHLVCCVIGIWFPDVWCRSSPSILCLGLKIAILSLTCWAADVATERLGSREDRTTNAMPYPASMSAREIAIVKRFYAKSQFAATTLSVFGTPMLSFLSVLAIELASFLMTLVRKGKIEARTYHALYGLGLFVMLPALVATLLSGDLEAELATYRALCVACVAVQGRLVWKWGKYFTWVVSPVVGCVMASALASAVHFKWVCWIGMAWSAGETLLYRPEQPKASGTECPAAKTSGRGSSFFGWVAARPILWNA
ncbi:unnamed protein product [Prorocentrum cordatum]|uniref:Uncharacterized protein n=1 Tax=Prorocentrum cordatum TaxID=2364126 RepID=A0ABN9TBQ4_9DINO|nr:unnamed protein product [Polarella glacialis]